MNLAPYLLSDLKYMGERGKNWPKTAIKYPKIRIMAHRMWGNNFRDDKMGLQMNAAPYLLSVIPIIIRRNKNWSKTATKCSTNEEF